MEEKFPCPQRRRKFGHFLKKLKSVKNVQTFLSGLVRYWENNMKKFPVVECGEVHWFEIYNEPKSNEPLDVMMILIMPREPIWTKNGKLAPSQTDTKLANHYLFELKRHHLSFYVTDLLKCGLASVEENDFRNLGSEVGRCWRFLQQEIEILQPRKIITFGKHPKHDVSLLLALSNEPQVVKDKICPLLHPRAGIDKDKFHKLITELIKEKRESS